VRGKHAMGYRPGDCFTVEKFYVKDTGKDVCLHALASMLTLLTLFFLKGISARILGIGAGKDVSYIQCPDPEEPYTSEGTAIFEIKRGSLNRA